MTFSDINFVLPSSVEAPSTARQSLGELKGLVGEEKLEDLRLMVTEAVTNSVRHASLGFEDEIQLEI